MLKKQNLLKVIDKLSSYYLRNSPGIVIGDAVKQRTANFLAEFPFEHLPNKTDHEGSILLEMSKSLSVMNLVNNEHASKGLREEDRVSCSPPIIITGMPGTGGSLLQKLLSLDTSNRTPLRYQVLHPLECQGTIEERIDDGSGFDDDTRRIGASALDPDEDIGILSYALYYFDFMTSIASSSTFTPRMYKWITQPAVLEFQYAFHRRFAQLMNSQLGSVPARWVFSDPSHLGHLETLHKVYPDAKVIFTHRRIRDAVFGVVAQNVAICPDENVPKITVYSPRKSLQPLVDSVASAIKYRRGLSGQVTGTSDTTFADVFFEDLVAEPVDTLERLYANYGIPLTDEYRAALTQWLEDHPMALNDYKLTLRDCGYKHKADLYDHWKDYIAYFPRVKRGREVRDGDAEELEDKKE